jgi:GntR family transcriptional regulator
MSYKYEDVAVNLREMIRRSLPNTALPPERELMKTFSVSRMTVRNAIAALSRDGLIYNVHGSGTYVAPIDLLSTTPKLLSFTEDMTSRGFMASSRVLDLKLIDADQDVAYRLGVEEGTLCINLRRLRLADREPMAIENVYLPASIMNIDDFQQDRSLYEQLKEAGHIVYHSQQQVNAIILDPDEARLLFSEAGSAALRVERFAASRRGEPIEFARTIYRADRYFLRMSVTRHESYA